MFKCKECGCEYKDKPEFCDCGNDEFEEINEFLQEIPEKVQQKRSLKVSSAKSPLLKQTVEPYAIAIFVFCVVLSFVILFFIGNPKDQPVQKQEQNVINTQIPSIDKLWNSSTKGIEKYNQPENVIPVQPQTKKVEKNLPKTILKKDSTKNTPIKKAENKLLKKEEKKVLTPITTQPKVVTPQKPPIPKTTVKNVQELNNYKIQLRNKIASRIDFTQVIGDGSCTISFTISSEGALTNRKFLKQSDNDTLNDVVFTAMLATSSFSIPPAGYKGETLKLGVKIYSGQFEVSLN